MLYLKFIADSFFRNKMPRL